ncbi:sulfite exporter TauE/SafE family protein [Vibrio sp. 10N.286.52.B1]|uniref:sulfite exporter TauE/SafE family protein n=1 Tax=Vibrio sp. 10N.286.52.B1 TaxID=3229712 RepID=UPI003552788E
MIELLIGIGLGFVISMTGVGGGVLMIPVLRLIFGLDPIAAVATANFCSMLMKIASSVTHYQLGNIPMRSSYLFLAITAPTTVLASYFVALAAVSPYQYWVENGVDALVIIAMLFSLSIMIRRKKHPSASQVITNKPSTYRAIFPGLLSGSIIGATGVGGGVIVLPILTRFLGLNIKQAIGTSIFTTMVLSGLAALMYGLGGKTDVTLSAHLFLGSLIAAPIAHRVMKVISSRMLDTITLSLVGVSVLSLCLSYLM